MHTNMILESLIAQERRRDLLRQVEQEEKVHLAKARRASNAKTGRPARDGLKARMNWRKAAV